MADTSRALLADTIFGNRPFWWPALPDYGKFYNCAGDNASGTRCWRWLEAVAPAAALAAVADTSSRVTLDFALAYDHKDIINYDNIGVEV